MAPEPDRQTEWRRSPNEGLHARPRAPCRAPPPPWLLQAQLDGSGGGSNAGMSMTGLDSGSDVLWTAVKRKRKASPKAVLILVTGTGRTVVCANRPEEDEDGGSSRCSFTTQPAPLLSSLPPSHLWCVMWGKYQQSSRPVTTSASRIFCGWLVSGAAIGWWGAGDRWELILFGPNHPSHFLLRPCEDCNFPDV